MRTCRSNHETLSCALLTSANILTRFPYNKTHTSTPNLEIDAALKSSVTITLDVLQATINACIVSRYIIQLSCSFDRKHWCVGSYNKKRFVVC